MKPIKFKGQNTTFIADGCGDLPAYKDDDQIISCWKGSIIDRVRYLLTGKIWFSVYGQSQPPIWLSTDDPFMEV